ncbi:hypothetical protein N0V83_005922 [Neocucurbitaria cava]|uniref:DUF1772-domain-containing protein n=1 Tax=Neocucurbitaria cava TaxID=798079 RepID=A0A9W8Y609_9PLEO|nr:hypothetical protein N0V83_005922 [Neocucurbitaria cava]
MEKLTPILQAYFVLAIALAAGTNISTTIITLPALLHASPSTLATHWKILFDTGITPVLSLAMSSAVGFATLAYRATYTSSLASTGLVSHAKRNLYIAAAVAAFGLAPYTKLLMWRNISELERRAQLVEKGDNGKGENDTHALVKQWGTLNLYRGFMLLSSAGLWIRACVS